MGNKTINSKQVIGIILFIFAMLIIYKYVSSGIERESNLKARRPLDACLYSVEEKLDRQITDMQNILREENHSRCGEDFKKFGFKSDCRWDTYESLKGVIQEYEDEAEKEKLECYRRYK